MCCSKRAQRLQERQLSQSSVPTSPRPRGCCGARKERRLLRELEEHATNNCRSSEIAQIQPQGVFLSGFRQDQSPMAGIIAVGISMGAEKLGRKISEKRLERKDKKAAAVSFDSSFWMRIADLW
jgi:predicted alpha/beta-fold hydrolase